MKFLVFSSIMLAAGTFSAFPQNVGTDASDSLTVNASAATALTDTAAVRSETGNTDHAAISGTVTDRKGQPLIGANVKIKENAGKIAVTDIDGNFSIPDAPENCTLQISYVGYTPVEKKVTPDKRDYSIVMRVNNSVLNEVVVVGYATQKKVDLTGAVSSVRVDALEDRPITNATNALAGHAAGLTVTNSGGNNPGFE